MLALYYFHALSNTLTDAKIPSQEGGLEVQELLYIAEDQSSPEKKGCDLENNSSESSFADSSIVSGILIMYKCYVSSWCFQKISLVHCMPFRKLNQEKVWALESVCPCIQIILSDAIKVK